MNISLPASVFFFSDPPCPKILYQKNSLPPPSYLPSTSPLLPTTYLPPPTYRLPTPPPSLHRQSSRDLERLELEHWLWSWSCGCGAGAATARARAGPMRPRDPRAHEEVRCLLFLLFFLFCLFMELRCALQRSSTSNVCKKKRRRRRRRWQHWCRRLLLPLVELRSTKKVTTATLPSPSSSSLCFLCSARKRGKRR